MLLRRDGKVKDVRVRRTLGDLVPPGGWREGKTTTDERMVGWGVSPTGSEGRRPYRVGTG